MNSSKVTLAFYISITLLYTTKLVSSFSTVPKKFIGCERSKLLLSFYDGPGEEEDSFYFPSDEEDESEQMRLERLVSQRIAEANARFRDRYSENENTFHHSSAEEFASERMLSREKRISELKRIDEQRARAQKIEAMKRALEEERRIEAERVQDEAMAAERVRLEAQQRARDIDAKRKATEETRNETTKQRKQYKQNKEFIDVQFEIVGNQKPKHYDALMTDGMSFATEKAERFIAEQESRLAEDLRSRNPRKKVVASPKQFLGRIAVEEARLREEKALAEEILQDAKIASKFALEECDTTELVRLAAVESEAARIIEDKNHELAIIEKEKRLAEQIVDEIERRN